MHLFVSEHLKADMDDDYSSEDDDEEEEDDEEDEEEEDSIWETDSEANNSQEDRDALQDVPLSIGGMTLYGSGRYTKKTLYPVSSGGARSEREQDRFNTVGKVCTSDQYDILFGSVLPTVYSRNLDCDITKSDELSFKDP
jgi:hypothetical protein